MPGKSRRSSSGKARVKSNRKKGIGGRWNRNRKSPVTRAMEETARSIDRAVLRIL